jgi:hypothetical protein
MALKGIGIDPNIYVGQGFYTPETYTTPPPSQGDYFTPQGYAELDYVLEALDLVSTFTIQAEGELDIAKATLVSTFTLTADGQDFDFASATLTSTFTTSTLGGYRHFGSAEVLSTSTTASDANITYDPSNTINISTSTQQTGNVDYSATPTLDSVATQVSVGAIFYDAASEGQQDDYTWDDFAESDVIDRTWNEWFGGKWHPGLIAFSRLSTVQVNAGLLFGGSLQNAQAVASFNADGNVAFDDSSVMNAAYTIQSDYTRTRNPDPASYSITATTSQDGNVSFSATVQPIDLEFSTDQDGNVIFGFSAVKDLLARITTTQNANVRFDPTNGVLGIWTTDQNGNVFYTDGASLSAFNTTFTLGRLIVIADPWNILTVKQESRTLLAPRENNIFEVLQETRVNNIGTETRGYKVPQETRAFKIYKPIFTRRSSIPKVRAER